MWLDLPIRDNLDLEGKHTDEEIWQLLWMSVTAEVLFRNLRKNLMQQSRLFQEAK